MTPCHFPASGNSARCRAEDVAAGTDGAGDVAGGGDAHPASPIANTSPTTGIICNDFLFS
jgi:hypothetical protein